MNIYDSVQSASSGTLLSGKTAFITGAGSGIGRAAALTMARHGAAVGLIDLKDGRCHEVEEEIRKEGGRALFIDTDVSDPARMEHAAASVAREFGGQIHLLFANAGINGTLAPIENMAPEDWDKTLAVNLKGSFLALKYGIPYMKESGGSIIITSSINGNRKFSGFGMCAYSSSKAGQVAFAKMAALELARYHIRVNAIFPGAIETNIGESTNSTPQLDTISIPVNYPEGSQPLEHGPGLPQQVADLVLFLSSHYASHITGTEIYIDGAETLL